MDVRLESLPPVEVLAMARLGAYADTAPCVWHDIWAWLRERGLADSADGAYGFGMDHPDYLPPALCRYVAAISHPKLEEIELTSELFRMILPGGRYAIHRMQGPYAQMKEVFPKLRDDWLPGSGLEGDFHRPFLEIYINDPKQVEESEILTDLCIPIKG